MEYGLPVTQTGTGQGQVISPLLANIYLHHVLDEWFEEEVKPRLRGQAAEIGTPMTSSSTFRTERTPSEFFRLLSKRFAKFGLTLHP